MKKLFVFAMILSLISGTGFAGQDAVQGAAKKVGDEIVDSVAKELVGKETVTTEVKPATLPPGLAKKGKVPPGWQNKSEVKVTKEKEPGLIEKWVSAIFKKAQPKETSTSAAQQ